MSNMTTRMVLASALPREAGPICHKERLALTDYAVSNDFEVSTRVIAITKDHDEHQDDKRCWPVYSQRGRTNMPQGTTGSDLKHCTSFFVSQCDARFIGTPEPPFYARNPKGVGTGPM